MLRPYLRGIARWCSTTGTSFAPEARTRRVETASRKEPGAVYGPSTGGSTQHLPARHNSREQIDASLFPRRNAQGRSMLRPCYKRCLVPRMATGS